MGISDLIITLFYFLILFIIAYLYKSENKGTILVRNYFLSAYILRIAGGIAFACIYYFYYFGGDTFNYHNDSIIISSTIRNDLIMGLKLLFGKLELGNYETYEYVIKMYFKHDPPSQIVVKIAAVINLFTFDSFLSTTVIFSLIGFAGSWKLFLTLCKLFPTLHKELSIGCLYLPSILFWTSGIMKDTLCTAALCYLFSSIIEIFIYRKKNFFVFFTLAFSFYLIYSIKIYILISFIPTIFIYIFSLFYGKIKNARTKTMIKPVAIVLSILFSYLIIDTITKENIKYNLANIEQTAQITANYIGAVSIKTGGSFYNLGELDFSITNIPILIIKAFNVTFYRPYIWELNSPLMIFSFLEGSYFIYLSFLFIRHVVSKKKFKNVFTPFTSFCFLFAISFAFIVGITSNNFGTLARYKSLMLPFFVCGIYVTINDLKIGNKKKSLPPKNNSFTT